MIGIGGSIFGGILVNWVTGRILGRRENREYLQKVIGANREVVYAIRPGISEGLIPTADVLKSLVNATARRYGVDAGDLYTPPQIAEELVKEVMDSSFISSAQKNEYCGRLAELGATAKKDTTPPAKEPQPRAIAEYRERLTSSVSMLLGLLTATMTVMYMMLDLTRMKKPETVFGQAKNLDFLLPVLAAMVTIAVTVLIFGFYRDMTRKRRDASAEIFLATLRRDAKSRESKPKPPSSE